MSNHSNTEGWELRKPITEGKFVVHLFIGFLETFELNQVPQNNCRHTATVFSSGREHWKRMELREDLTEYLSANIFPIVNGSKRDEINCWHRRNSWIPLPPNSLRPVRTELWWTEIHELSCPGMGAGREYMERNTFALYTSPFSRPPTATKFCFLIDAV